MNDDIKAIIESRYDALHYVEKLEAERDRLRDALERIAGGIYSGNQAASIASDALAPEALGA